LPRLQHSAPAMGLKAPLRSLKVSADGLIEELPVLAGAPAPIHDYRVTHRHGVLPFGQLLRDAPRNRRFWCEFADTADGGLRRVGRAARTEPRLSRPLGTNLARR